MNTTSRPVTVSIPHSLGREEALRRIKSGFASASTSYGKVLMVEEQVWTGNRLAFRVGAMGQSAFGTIDVAEDHVVMEITLPGFLGMLAEKLIPAIRKEGTLLLEKNKP
jgi:Putative polyhydroxyalkanoic acid system protein (PHA_gran_rgn)